MHGFHVVLPRLERQTPLFYFNVTQKKEIRINMSDVCDYILIAAFVEM